MKVMQMKQIKKEPLDEPIFTGSDVTLQKLTPESKEFAVNIVNFGKGVRNKFHTHDCDQILIVTDGEGIVATKEEEIKIVAGDVVFIPADEVHRHGAAPGSTLSHIYICRYQDKLTQYED